MAVTVDDTGTLQGAIVSVPVPKLVTDTYINLGSAHNVKVGDYFLAYNDNIRTIAVLKVAVVMDRRSTVKAVAQLASLRRGDRVRAITTERALDLKKQLSSLTAGAPPLGADVIVEPEMLAASGNIGMAVTGVQPAPTAVPGQAGPDLSDLIILTRAGNEGVSLTWIPPAQETGRIAGYLLYRTTEPAQPGIRLTPAPVTGQSFEDKTPIPGVPAVYRLSAVTATGAESAKAVSVEVIYTPPKSGTLGIGGSPAQVKTRNLPVFVMNGIPASAAAPLPAANTNAPAIPPVPTAPPLPAANTRAPAIPPVPTTPPLPAANTNAPAIPPVPTTPPLPAANTNAPAIPPVPTAPPLPAANTNAPAIPPVPTAPANQATPSSPPVPPSPAETAPPASPGAEDPPPPPENVSVAMDGSAAVVKWSPAPSKSPLAGYLVYRAGTAEEEGAALTAEPSPATEYRDKTVKEGESYVYYVLAQTKTGKRSAPSSKPKVDVPKSSGAVPFF